LDIFHKQSPLYTHIQDNISNLLQYQYNCIDFHIYAALKLRYAVI
jgi:hypothetical protein